MQNILRTYRTISIVCLKTPYSVLINYEISVLVWVKIIHFFMMSATIVSLAVILFYCDAMAVTDRHTDMYIHSLLCTNTTTEKSCNSGFRISNIKNPIQFGLFIYNKFERDINISKHHFIRRREN